MIGIGDPLRAGSAGIAAAISAYLCLHVLLRSPRNTFSRLIVALTLSVAVWNTFECIKLITREGRLMCFMFVGISFIPAILAHFGMAFLQPRPSIRYLIGFIYCLAGMLSVVALSGLWSEDAMAFIELESNFPFNYNGLFLGVMGPVLLGTLLLIAVRWYTDPPEFRGVFGWLLLAVLVGMPAGVADLAEGAGLPGIRISNIGAALACGCVLLGVLRHREYFDSLSRLRERLPEETRNLIAEARHGLVTLDLSGHVLFVNRIGEAFLGGRPAELPEIDDSLPALLQAGGQRLFNRGGRVLKATMVGAPRAAMERSRRYLLLQDCTREYELLHELSQRESLASLGEAAATLAHEIKNPLTAIGTAVEVLSREDAGNSDLLSVIRGELGRLNELVSKSLGLARRLDLHREQHDLAVLVARIASQLPGNVEIGPGPGTGGREVHVDPDLLSQVVVNLVVNAEEAGASRVVLSTGGDEDYATLRVANDGPPIPPEVLGRLFQPFVTSKSKGTGLGLALSSKIVTAHGGTIQARNTEDGVELEVRIPWMS